jgi:hypothetical protein
MLTMVNLYLIELDYIKIQYIRISLLKSPNMHVHRDFSALGNCHDLKKSVRYTHDPKIGNSRKFKEIHDIDIDYTYKHSNYGGIQGIHGIPSSCSVMPYGHDFVAPSRSALDFYIYNFFIIHIFLISSNPTMIGETHILQLYTYFLNCFNFTMLRLFIPY